MEGTVVLNVGGSSFTTTRATASRSSLLARLLAEKPQPLFVDRSGVLFEYVLEAMRTGALLSMPPSLRAAVLAELKHFGVTPPRRSCLGRSHADAHEQP